MFYILYTVMTDVKVRSKSAVIVIFLGRNSDFLIYDCHFFDFKRHWLYFDGDFSHFDRDVSTYDCHFDSRDCDTPIYDCDISPISRYHITYNLFIISVAPHSLLLIAAMNAHTVTLLIHNFSDKSIPEACLHSFNIVSTISGTSVQGA